MKKNLALLFAIYFFVVQPIFAWILRQDMNLLLLGIINFIVLLAILLIYKATETTDESQSKRTHSKAEIAEEKETLFHAQHTPANKGKKKTGSGKGIRGILLALAAYIFLMGSSLGYRLILASLFALILLFLICLVSRQASVYLKLVWTKILLGFFILGLIVFGFEYTFLTVNTSLQEYVQQNTSDARFLGISYQDETPPLDTWTGEGSIIATGTLQGDDLFTLSGDTQEEIIEDPLPIVTPSGVSLSMGDMVKALIMQYDIPLVTSKDVKFSYVSYSNPLYPYFRTAYAKTLLGSNTNPEKLALCDTMIAMKGILEKWTISKSSNVLQAYRNYAAANDRLKGCEQGKVVKDSNL